MKSRPISRLVVVIDDDPLVLEATGGLGLAIVDRLCRLLDHPFNLTSTPGKGSCFSVAVPVAAPIEQASAPARQSHVVPGGKLVAIIDDDPLVRDGMNGLLQSWGCQVLTAATAGGMLARVAECGRTPDLIVSDYHLPGGTTGIGAIATLRKSLAANIPAFLITGDTDAAQVNQADLDGFHLLHKPVEPGALRAICAQVLAQGNVVAETVGAGGASGADLTFATHPAANP